MLTCIEQCFCFVLSQHFEMYPKWLQTYNVAKAAFSQFFCLLLLNSEIIGVCHHIIESLFFLVLDTVLTVLYVLIDFLRNLEIVCNHFVLIL